MNRIDGAKPRGADDLIASAIRLVYSYICSRYSNKDVAEICNELRIIAKIKDFDFYTDEKNESRYTYAQVQENLSKINEKETIRKNKGVYYTPNDVVRFILVNSVKSLFGKLTKDNISDMDLCSIPYKSFCYKKTVFDPTCGAGEYLLATLEMKLALLKQNKQVMPYCIPDIIIRDIESQKPVAVIDAKYKPNTRSARSDTHQLLSYVLLTDVKRCGFVFPGVNSCAKIMDATETVSLPLAVDSLDYYELILGNDLDGASEALRQVLP